MKPSLLLTCFLLGCSSDPAAPTTAADSANTDSAEPAETEPADTDTDTQTATDTASADDTAVTGASFDDVYTKVLSLSCSSGYCHGNAAGGWSFSADKAATHAQLVGPASSQCSGLKRVAPGEPEQSALYLKVRGEFAGTCNGDKMPPPNGSLTAEQLEIVRSWIAAGAPGP
jgi:hypothetical protein